MPVLEHAGASIHYEVHGRGYPLMLFAPGGMASVADLWAERPEQPGVPMPWIDPRTQLSDRFTVISMDQRNAGRSTAPVSPDDGWETYAADHVALMDHLGIERLHVMGGCIGSSYCLGLCKAAPDRLSAAVLQNPIGLSANNRPRFLDMFDGWAQSLLGARRGADEASLASFRRNMFGGQFVFSVGREFVRSCRVPLLVLPGNDEFHPAAVAGEIVELAPCANLLAAWAGPDRHEETARAIAGFLESHTPRT